MSKLLTVVAATALVAMLAVGGVAIAKPVQEVNFTAKYLSKDTKKNTGALSLRTQFTISDDAGGFVTPVTRLQLRFPKGATTSSKGFASCSDQVIFDSVGKKCNKNSVLGSGKATASAQPIVANVNADVTLYNGGGSSSSPVISIFAVPDIGPNLIVSGKLQKGGSKYGYILDNTIAPIQTLPGAPNAAVTSFDATVGKIIKKGKKRYSFISAPLLCSGTYFLLDGTFTYEGGISNTVYETFTLNGGPRCP